jgi:Rps23 Pro-64 3,4-dihydroxylase Tpa1-like proline 4-hydroxylase
MDTIGRRSFYSGEFVQNPSDNLFYKHDVLKTVLPRRNRIVMFDSNIIHGVHPLSKSFKGLRTTLMFKLKNTHFKNLIQNAT